MCTFFFSSRRRHTRLQGDWSSDVCSSDLPASCTCMPKSTKLATIWACACAWLSPPITPNDTRSEERRVGKECRSRWTADHERNKRYTTHRGISWLQQRKYVEINMKEQIAS